MKKFKTDYKGVFYRIGKRIGKTGEEKIYYVTYKLNGKKIERKTGRQYKDNMTPAKAARLRGSYIEGRDIPLKEKREIRKATKAMELNKPTISKLWEEYIDTKPELKSMMTDQNRFKKHIQPLLGEKIPDEILPLDIDRLRLKQLKGRAPATIRNTLELLRRIINFAVNRNRCTGLTFKLEMPIVNNETTEELSTKQLQNLLVAIENDSNTSACRIMKMALYTGMRRGEIFKLKWENINFESGFIKLCDPKGYKDQRIPINDTVRVLLENHPHTKGSPYVFPGRDGKKRVCVKKAVNKIKKKAGIPKEFRALHGLRHVYASMLSSSGKVDMYVLQKLMTHKSPKMTQRYAILRDDALKKGARQIDNIFKQKKEVKKIVKIK